MRVEQGYQYEIGHNFPCQYLRIDDPTKELDQNLTKINEGFLNENKKQSLNTQTGRMKSGLRKKFMAMMLER